MTDLAESLIEAFRKFRHNHHKFCHYRTKHTGDKTLKALYDIRHLSAQLAKEVMKQKATAVSTEQLKELDKLLRIEQLKEKNAKKK